MVIGQVRSMEEVGRRSISGVMSNGPSGGDRNGFGDGRPGIEPEVNKKGKECRDLFHTRKIVQHEVSEVS